MGFRKCFGLMLVCCFSLFSQSFSQSYYYAGGKDTTKFWRVNLKNGSMEVFYSNAINPLGSVSWDPAQKWIFVRSDNSYKKLGDDEYCESITAINASNYLTVHTFPDQFPHPSGTTPNTFYTGAINGREAYDGIIYNSVKNVFYVTWNLPSPDSLVNWDELSPYQRTVICDASTFSVLDTLAVPPDWITSSSSVSDDGNYLYMEKWSPQKPLAIGKYSLISQQLQITRDLSSIVAPGTEKMLHDSKKGKYLLFYAYPQLQITNVKYALYNIDLDTSVVIPFPLLSHGSISSDGKYVIIEETPLRPDYKSASDEYFHPGRISIFSGVSGRLLQHLQLPANGKLLVFDNYPDSIFYYLEKKHTSINIDLTKLVTIAAIVPQTILTGSGGGTLIVTGKNFTSASKVQLNGANRSTTILSDTMLQATIRPADVDTPITAYIAVHDDNATSDSLALSVISILPQTLYPFLDCVTKQNDTTYTAWFGYENTDSVSVSVPVGPQNKFTPSPNDRSQPIVFEPGKKDKMFGVIFDGKNLTWKLNGNEIVASKKSPQCN